MKPLRTPRTQRSQRIPDDSLESLRTKICTTLEEYLTTCDLDTWFDQYAPSCKVKWNDAFLDIVEQRMRETGRLSDDGWTQILEAMKDNENESNTFKYIADIAAGVADAAKAMDNKLEPTAIIESTPDDAPMSEVKAHKFKPGFHSILPFPEERVDPRFFRRSGRISKQKNTPEYKSGEKLSSMNTSDTVVVGEVKKETKLEHVRDNELKLCGGATELLYNDPCRRFVNGFTIEKFWMRIWRFERSHVCVSASFDFHKEPRRFILFLLYITFASHTDLGHDPTVVRYTTRIPREGILNPTDARDYDTVIAYRYQVGDRYFLTVGHPISESSAWNITSRSTRVWVVREVSLVDGKAHEFKEGKDSDTLVLKDAYLFEDAMLEKDIREAIIARLREIDNQQTSATNYAEQAEARFMTYVCDEVVKLPDENKVMWSVDDLTTRMTVQEPNCFTPLKKPASSTLVEASDDAFVVPGSQHSSSRPGSQRESIRDAQKPSSIVERQRRELNYHRRKHVRTVQKEICQSIYELPDWQTLIRCLIDIVEGLNLLRIAGWVHRDISGGNCLWHIDGEQGKIADLEYAKPYDHTSSNAHDPRTGTPEFMATEYQTRKYLHKVQVEGLLKIRAPFIFNFYHDLESVFWIYAWSLFHHPPSRCVAGAAKPQDFILSLRQGGMPWFACGIDGNLDRYNDVRFGMHDTMNDSLEDVYTPGNGCSVLLDGLEVVTILSSAYEQLEKNPLQLISNQQQPRWRDDLFSAASYRDMQNMFRGVLNAMGQSQDRNFNVYVPPLSGKIARYRETTEGEDDNVGAPEEKRTRLV